jgi:YjbE family integral membrane protein
VFEFFGADALTALLQVILIDLVLAGDNAIVIGLAAAGLPEAQRGKAILIGIVAATMLRILFAGLTAQILQVVGLLFAGGILLLWVCWKMWRELRASSAEPIKAMQAAGSSCRNKSRWQAPENARPSDLTDYRG